MIALPDALLSLHLLLVLGLLGIASVLLLVTVTNRLRIRHTVLSWRRGPMWGLPIGPSIFVALIVGAAALAFALGRPLGVALLGGYLAAGLFWMISSYLSRSIIVTEYGLITNVNCSDLSVAWGQVVDYFTFDTGKRQGHVFIYVDPGGKRKRLEVAVPAALQEDFVLLVARKIDNRFELPVDRSHGSRAFH